MFVFLREGDFLGYEGDLESICCFIKDLCTCKKLLSYKISMKISIKTKEKVSNEQIKTRF